MYVAIAKLTFEEGPKTADDRKELRALTEKLRARFKVSAAAVEETGSGGATALAVAALGSSAERLSKTLDAIAEFCEASGFGRVESEQALLDHLDNLTEDEEP
jgi:uncharacterized protein YlxP (DUF503 family)